MLQRHCQQHLDAFVTASRRSGQTTNIQLGISSHSYHKKHTNVTKRSCTWPRWRWPCAQPALCSTLCVRCGNRSDAGWRWETWRRGSPCLWTSQRWCPGYGYFWRRRPGSLLLCRMDPSDWKIQEIKWHIYEGVFVFMLQDVKTSTSTTNTV